MALVPYARRMFRSALSKVSWAGEATAAVLIQRPVVGLLRCESPTTLGRILGNIMQGANRGQLHKLFKWGAEGGRTPGLRMPASPFALLRPCELFIARYCQAGGIHRIEGNTGAVGRAHDSAKALVPRVYRKSL